MVFKTSLGSLNPTKIVKEALHTGAPLAACLIIFRSRAKKQFAVLMTVDKKDNKRSLLINLTNFGTFRPVKGTQVDGFKYVHSGMILAFGADEVSFKNGNPPS